MTSWREAQQKLRRQVSRTYANKSLMWHPAQPWSWHVHRSLTNFLQPFLQIINNKNGHVLNSGCGNNTYGLPNRNTINIDLFYERVNDLENAVVGDVVQLPFGTKAFDHVICVGSVVAYSPLIETIREIDRILKIGGKFILHFESSTSGEFILTTTYGRTATIASTFNDEGPENAWVYHPQFVTSTLNAYGFVVQRRGCAHVISSLVYRLTMNEHLSSKFGCLDWLACRIPILRGFAENVFIECQKIAIPFVENDGKQ